MYHPFSVSESVDKKDVLSVIPSLEDESAIRRAELLRKYVLPHKNLIYSICIKYTFNQEDVEDNYQEALINFFKYMDSYDPRRPVKTWIYAVTQRLMTDLNNRNRNRLLPDENVDVGGLKSTRPQAPQKTCISSLSLFFGALRPHAPHPSAFAQLFPAEMLRDIAAVGKAASKIAPNSTLHLCGFCSKRIFIQKNFRYLHVYKNPIQSKIRAARAVSARDAMRSVRARSAINLPPDSVRAAARLPQNGRNP